MLVCKLVAKDGKFEPPTLEVPAGKRFKIEISNDGKGPMEFESKDLKQEKVLAAGAKSSVVINRAEARHVRLLRRIPSGRAEGQDRREVSCAQRHSTSVMGNALFIIWRESAEAMLVVGILYAWLRKHPDVKRGMRYLWAGVARGRRSRARARGGDARHRAHAVRARRSSTSSSR